MADVDLKFYADDGAGSLLSPLPFLDHHALATNPVHDSRDLTNWTITAGADIAAYDEVGLDGWPNTASTLTDDSATVMEQIKNTDVAVVDDSSTHTHKIWIKKDAITARYPRIAVQCAGGTLVTNYCFLNTSTGVLNQVSGTDNYEVVDDGDWWIALLELTNNSSGNIVTVNYLAPAASLDGATTDNSATGSIIVGNAEIHTNKTIEKVRVLPPIFTTVGTITTQADACSLDILNHNQTRGAIYFELQPSFATSEVSGDLQLLSLNGSAGLAYYDGTNGDVESSDGTNTATRAQTLVAGTTYKIGIVYGDGNLRVCVDGSWGTEQSYDGAYALGSVMELFKALTYSCKMRDFQIWDLSYSDGTTKMVELMA